MSQRTSIGGAIVAGAMLLGCGTISRTDEATRLARRLSIPIDDVQLVRRCSVNVAAKGTFKVLGGGDAVCYVTRDGFHLRWRGDGPEIPKELVSLPRAEVESISLYDGAFPSQLQL